MKTNKLILLLFIFLIVQACNPKNAILKSPNGQTNAELILTEGIPSFNINFDGELIIQQAKPNITNGGESVLNNLKISKVEDSQFDKTWNTVNGKNKTVRNHYNQYLIHLKNDKGQIIKMETRVYDQGFAYRFVFPEEIKNVIENTQLSFANDFTFWAYNREKHNIGPVKLTEYKAEIVQIPVVFQTPANNYFAIHEAAIFEHAPFELLNDGSSSFMEVLHLTGRLVKL